MNRRELIKIFAGFGAFSFLSRNVTKINMHSQQLHFVGLGSAGSEVLQYFYGKGIIAKYTLVNDEMPFIPGISFIEFIPPKDVLIANGDKVKRISRMETEALIPEQVKRIFSSDDHFVILSALGGYTGTKLTTAINEYLKLQQKKYSVISSLPFGYESQSRKLYALNVTNQLKTSPIFYPINLQIIRQRHGNLRIIDACMKGNEMFYDAFKYIF